MPRMLGMRVPSATDLQGLPPQALVLGLPWQRLPELSVITRA